MLHYLVYSYHIIHTLFSSFQYRITSIWFKTQEPGSVFGPVELWAIDHWSKRKAIFDLHTRKHFLTSLAVQLFYTAFSVLLTKILAWAIVGHTWILIETILIRNYRVYRPPLRYFVSTHSYIGTLWIWGCQLHFGIWEQNLCNNMCSINVSIGDMNVTHTWIIVMVPICAKCF